MTAFFARIENGAAVALTTERAPLPVPDAPPEGSVGVVRLVDGRVDFEVLAEAGSARAALYRLAASSGVDPVFPPEVEEELAARVAAPNIDDPALKDLRAQPYVTIDGATSKDLDQAVFVETTTEGSVVWYALADPASFAPPGSALFGEALVRGASYYLPGLMVPMLPAALSEDLVSLNPGVDRRAMVFEMHLDAAGECTRTQVHHARVRSRAKLSFGGVQAFYDGEPLALPAEAERAAIETSLHALREVGGVRARRAAERGVIKYRRSEVALELGDGGHRFVVLESVRRPVERYNEQMSLLCNVQGAKLLRRAMGEPVDGASDEARVEPIFRVHPPPPADRVARFEALLRELAQALALDPATWTWKRGEDLSAFLDALPTEGEAGRLARAIHRQAVILNTRSVFGAEPGGHHGVGAEVYGRFSAPMREVVGVYLHHETWQALGEVTGPEDAALRAQVIEVANRAKQTQRALTHGANRLVLDQLFGELGPGETLRGTVMGLTRGKVHVLLDAPPIDVKIYVRHLARQQDRDVRIDDAGTTLLAEDDALCHLGDAVDVSVQGKDEKRDRWILGLEKA